MSIVNKKLLEYRQFLERDHDKHHHNFKDEIYHYKLLIQGNPCASDFGTSLFVSSLAGHLSNNRTKNIKYRFVAAAAKICMISICCGMEEKDAYTASELYIQMADECTDEKSIYDIYTDMQNYYMEEISQTKRQAFSPTISDSIDYIQAHLNEKITLKSLAAHAEKNPNYLSSIFKKETGESLTAFIQNKKISIACDMLEYTNISYAEISSTLSFSSQSYFSKIFRKKKGITPMQYRNIMKASNIADYTGNNISMFFKQIFDEKNQNYACYENIIRSHYPNLDNKCSQQL